jgi:hypothetical protein
MLKDEWPDLFRQVRAGTLGLNEAMWDIKEARRREMRAANGRLVKRTKPISIRTQYQTIVIDTPWHYETEGFRNIRVPEVPYECLTLDQMAAPPVGDLAEKNCHLYLWTTNLFLPRSFALLEEWGFKYVTALVPSADTNS